MLTNAVVLFLKDALPIFWCVALLSLLVSHWRLWLWLGGAVGCILSLLLFANISTVANTFDGNGYEFIQITLLIISYLLCAWLYCVHDDSQKQSSKWVAAGTVVAYLITLNATNGVVFFSSFWQPDNGNQALVLGLLLGTGICASIATLLVLLLRPLASKAIARILLLLFAVGQLSQLTNLFEQIDWLNTEHIWNTSWLISDEHEIGQFLATLFGYESSPSAVLIVLFIFGFSLPVIIRRKLLAQPQFDKESNHEMD